MSDHFDFQVARETQAIEVLTSPKFLQAFEDAVQNAVRANERKTNLPNIGAEVNSRKYGKGLNLEGTKAFEDFRAATQAQGYYDVKPYAAHIGSDVFHHLEIELTKPEPNIFQKIAQKLR